MGEIPSQRGFLNSHRLNKLVAIILKTAGTTQGFPQIFALPSILIKLKDVMLF